MRRQQRFLWVVPGRHRDSLTRRPPSAPMANYAAGGNYDDWYDWCECNAASLASSSSTPSERNGHTASATNQLIMHRYKAKSSQLQSPVSSKRTMANDVHCAQPGTSKDSSSGENGEPSTPKSGRKWKKTKAGKQGSGGGGGLVPLLVQLCVSVVEANGLDTVGIYRIPGNTAAVNALKETLGQGLDSMTLENLDLGDPRWRDVNVVSSFLKMFLRKLPEPLLTDKLYPFFIDANRISSHHNRMHKLRNLLRKLPRHHYATLRYLINHLYEITKNSQVNKMETRNLALMFGPSIVRPSDDNMATMVTHMSDQCKIIETLIYYVERGFNSWLTSPHATTVAAFPTFCLLEGASAVEAPQYGVGVPSGVSAASFNDMHNLIRKANEEQAAAMMSEGKAGKERDIDAEIISRQTVSPLAAASSSALEQSPSIESSLGSIPDTSRTDPGVGTAAALDPSPCARNASASPRQRPQVLAVLAEARCQQKIRLRNRVTPRDPSRRHTLSDVDVLKEGRLEKFARWFGIRKSSPDVSAQHMLLEEEPVAMHPPLKNPPPVIVRTSPNELTPASGDEQL
ncbi:unnamed protein product [Heligmosomoides polygyrus]|uniref:Rho-GAP domain-containing protein n=1 Tax=Heligmosomoides polygyrus TaxID=6339 RepID=A0A3P7XVH4_HELPZ|nr:unnamed protein product [Heligmosomoides polygyrus]